MATNIKKKKVSELPEATDITGFWIFGSKTVGGAVTSVKFAFEKITSLFGVISEFGQSITLAVSQKFFTDEVAKLQPYIVPDSEREEIDFTSYIQNGVFSASGNWEVGTNRRSIKDMPVIVGSRYSVYNQVDKDGNKRVVFYNSTNGIIKVETYSDFTNITILIPENCTKISISLITDYPIPHDVSKISEIKLYKVGENSDVISSINGYPIKGGISKGEADKIYQPIILPDFVMEYTPIEFLAYVQNGAFLSTGNWQANVDNRSIVELPIEGGKSYKVSTPCDPTSSKARYFYDSANQVINFEVLPGNKETHVLQTPDNAAFLSMTLCSYYGDVSRFNETTIEKEEATDQRKQYIDEINGYPLVASSQISGGFKYASVYGFSTSNTAEQNASIMQSMLVGGGTVIVDKPGTYPLCNTMMIESNTTLFFSPGVVISMQRNSEGKGAAYQFINRGAFTRTYNENIKIIGLNLKTNGIDMEADVERIIGLRGYLALFYAKNIEIKDFTCLDVPTVSFCIHVCTFDGLLIDNVYIVGKKDGVHLGNGKNFIIRNGRFKTYDDPIALNAEDYVVSNPQVGWIENGLIENCIDLVDTSTTGFFARIMSGGWVDWYSGMKVQRGDKVISNNRLYRVYSPDAISTEYTSITAPTHLTGLQTIDGIQWLMVQDDNIIYSCACRNIHFKNIFLQKNRDVAISAHFDTGSYNRSLYPGGEVAEHYNISFENIYVQANIQKLLDSSTPMRVVKISDTDLKTSQLSFTAFNISGYTYKPTNILLTNMIFTTAGQHTIINGGRAVKLKTLGSILEETTSQPKVSGNVTVISNDIGL